MTCRGSSAAPAEAQTGTRRFGRRFDRFGFRSYLAQRLRHGAQGNMRSKQMDASMVKGIVIGGVAAIAVAASGVTGYKVLTRPPAFAEVVAVKEVTETINTPVEQCSEAQVQKRAPTKDEHRVTGSVIGAVAGGLLGSAVGGKGATVAGAAIGGVAGHEV